MKKIAGSLVVAILLMGLGLPLTASLAASAHACCRVHGEHHCDEAVETGDGHTIAAVCPHLQGAVFSNGSPAQIRQGDDAIATASVAVSPETADLALVWLTIRPSGRAPPTSLL
jgi:hypothetical protein